MGVDEGMGRPMEAWEEKIEGAVPIMADSTIKWPYEAEVEIDPSIPLNVADVISGRMRGMTDEQLARVVTAACILYQETSEGVGMIPCIYTATEMEKYKDGGP
jgi:hypothetical protein